MRRLVSLDNPQPNPPNHCYHLQPFSFYNLFSLSIRGSPPRTLRSIYPELFNMPRFSLSRPDISLPSLPLPKPLRSLPPAVVWQILFLITINAIIWAAIGVVLHFFPLLISSAVLSYTLGLRHALDADHISAIDLMTRRLIAAGQRPVSVGTWFSLGHSTIVIITCIVVAATSGALRDRFDGFQRVGNIIGTSVSAAFLLILCAGNAWVLHRLVKRLKVLLREQHQQASNGDEWREQESTAAGQLTLEGAGFLAHVFRKLFRIVDRPWKMYPLGVMFGLGFDTSSEIAILGIASIQGATGTSLWLILIFPLLFTGEFSPYIIYINANVHTDVNSQPACASWTRQTAR